MEENFKNINDKDKLILIANICIKNQTKQKATLSIAQMREYLKSTFDDSVKVLVMPVLVEELQKIEIFNAEKCDEEILQKLNENYEKIIESFYK
jgi:hypothetical protein